MDKNSVSAVLDLDLKFSTHGKCELIDKLTGFSAERITQDFFIKHKEKGKIPNNPPRLTYFSELINILNKANVFEEICSINSVPHVMTIQSWDKYIENCNAENFEVANFILEQMKLLNSNKHDQKEAATTIQCFLYSLLNKIKEIVSLNPVTNMNTEELHSMTLEILSLMEKVGEIFNVIILAHIQKSIFAL
ncbi:UNVERIFIED_CONTAM: hypothetical protein NCL1_50670 [Trichonephila clavipes]